MKRGSVNHWRRQTNINKYLGTKKESMKAWGVKTGSITTWVVHLFQGSWKWSKSIPRWSMELFRRLKWLGIQRESVNTQIWNRKCRLIDLSADHEWKKLKASVIIGVIKILLLNTPSLMRLLSHFDLHSLTSISHANAILIKQWDRLTLTDCDGLWIKLTYFRPNMNDLHIEHFLPIADVN